MKIDTSKLGKKPIPAWAFNIHRAMNYGPAVYRVWINHWTVWESDREPSPDSHGWIGGGSRMDHGPYFYTKAYAVEACLAAFDEWCEGVRTKIENAAKAEEVGRG